MIINSYSFGRITIDGTIYDRDLTVFPDRVETRWRREQGHNLIAEDLARVVDDQPDDLIIGTGKSGILKVSSGTSAYIKDKGIRLHVLRTDEAVELFNRLSADRNVVAALHLTC